MNTQDSMSLAQATSAKRLTLKIRTQLAKHELHPTSLAHYMPSLPTTGTKLDYVIEREQAEQAADFRAYDSPGMSVRFEGNEEARVSMIPITQEHFFTESDLVSIKNQDNPMLGMRFDNLIGNMVRNIFNRIEITRSDLMYDGKATINLSSKNATLELQSHRNEKLNVAAENLFSDKAHNPLTTIQKHIEIYNEVNNTDPKEMIMTSDVYEAIVSHPLVKENAIETDHQNVVKRSRVEGFIRELYDLKFRVVEPRRINVNSYERNKTVVKDLYRPGTILFTPGPGGDITRMDGAGVFGRTAMSNQLLTVAEREPYRTGTNDQSSWGIYAGYHQTEHPPIQRRLFIDGLVLPFVVAPDLMSAVKVL